MEPPTIDPLERDASQVAPADAYARDDRVWVHRDGTWHPGVVGGASERAVTVRYQPLGSRGTAVDTVTAEFLVPADRHSTEQLPADQLAGEKLPTGTTPAGTLPTGTLPTGTAPAEGVPADEHPGVAR